MAYKNRLQTKENESKENCAKKEKEYIEVDVNDFNCIHRSGKKYRVNDGKEY